MNRLTDVNNLDEILAIDHIDVFHVAPSDLAQSMGHIGNDDHPDVQRTIDEALDKIVASGRNAGTTVGAHNVAKFRDQGVKFFYTNLTGWMTAASREFMSALKG